MIAEDFGSVRVLATESIAGPTVEGARARHVPVCTRGQKTREGAASAVRHRTIIDIGVKLVKPKSFLTPTSGLVRNAG